MSTLYRNIARVMKTHGSKGEVVVAALRGLPFALRAGMSVCLTPPALHRDRFTEAVEVAEPLDGEARVHFAGVGDLTSAEGIVGCFVLARRSDLDLTDMDVAFEDLIGRDVVDERYGEIGRIEEVMETPANDVWVVRGSDHGEILLPVIDQVVPAIPEEGPIHVHVLDGLIES